MCRDFIDREYLSSDGHERKTVGKLFDAVIIQENSVTLLRDSVTSCCCLRLIPDQFGGMRVGFFLLNKGTAKAVDIFYEFCNL